MAEAFMKARRKFGMIEGGENDVRQTLHSA